MSRRKQIPELNGSPIADMSIRQPVFITMIMLALMVVGLLAYSRLPVNLYPDISVPIVAVQLLYTGAGPESVADQVAKPVEDTLISLSGVKNITSNSYEGATLITIEFETGVDVDVAEQDVRSKVNAIMPSLPSEVDDPMFFKFDPEAIPVISLVVFSKGEKSPVELREVVDDDIIPYLQRIQGVGSVTVSGGQQRQINVLLDLDKLQSRRILPVLVTRAIQNANINRGLGDINAGTVDMSLRAPSMYETPQDIGRTQITGTPYRISDVATVEEGIAEVENYARLDGRDAIAIDIIKRSDANIVQVAHSIREQVDVIFADYPDLEYYIPRDTSTFVEDSVDGAIEELFVASIAAMIVVFIFFRNVRNTLVTIIGLPVILISTFAAISLFGLTINVLTLMALSLSVGLVIDDAIVVRENIFRHTEMGELPVIAASKGTSEVALSVVAMTLTLIAVFVPVTFTEGIPGIIFKSFGITVASAMAISLFEAFTLAPMTSAHLFGTKKQHDHQHSKAAHPSSGNELDEKSTLDHELEEDVGWLGRFYERSLAWSLRHRMVVVVISLVIFVFSFSVATGLKFQFFPTSDQGTFYIGFELPPGTPLETTNELAIKTENILMQNEEIDAILTSVGEGGEGGGGGSAEKAQIFVKLHEDHRPTDDVIADLRPQLEFLPLLAFGQESRGSNSSQVTGRNIQLEVNTTRPLEELIPFLQQFQAQAGQIEGLVDIDTTYKPGKPELQILIDPSKTGNLGVTNDDIASSVRTLINGTTAAVFRKDGEDTDIEVRLRPGDRASVDDIRNISVPTTDGSIPIGSLVKVEFTLGPTTIRRYNRANQIIIGANVIGRNVNDVANEIRAGLTQMELPKGVDVDFGGDLKQQEEGFATMFIAMGLSILFVYMVLASQFASFTQPIVIMLAMPFSFLGAFLALRISGFALDIISMIGLIMLMGLVVKNSILMIDFTNRLREAGVPKNQALAKAGSIRLRPILMTSIAIVAGAVPVAIGMGEGSEIRQGLSIVLIGGMITSTLLTLVVVPTAYSLLEGFLDAFDRLKHWRPWRRTKQETGKESADSPASAPDGTAQGAGDNRTIAYAAKRDE